MITKEKIQKHAQLFLKRAQKHVLKPTSFHACFADLEAFARLNYKYNYNYSNNEAESLIRELSKSLLDTVEIIKTPNKIIFYDSFSLDNRGLTQQYLRAIFSWNSELLFITNSAIGKDILAELRNYPKARIVQYNKNSFKEYSSVLDEIVAFQPEKVLLHFSPWDIAGFCIWNAVKNTDRFLINLTDHAFWLGKECADYILEFRAYGAYLSVYERKIQIEKLLLQPYYPIINNKDFQGFPFKKNGIIAFSGSNLYKIAGRNNTFLRLIKEVLLLNKTLIFVLAGPGNKHPIERFIKENALQDRFFVIGDRKDISAVFENIDIYVNTFPMIGGLMSQYAAVYQKPIIGYTSPDLYGYNDVEDLLQVSKEGLLVRKDKTDFIEYFSKLVQDIECRNTNIFHTKDCVFTPEKFSHTLHDNMYTFNGTIDSKFIENVSFDSQTIVDLYLDMENTYQKNHYAIFWYVLRFKAFTLFPASILLFLTKKIIEKFVENLQKAFANAKNKIV